VFLAYSKEPSFTGALLFKYIFRVQPDANRHKCVLFCNTELQIIKKNYLTSVLLMKKLSLNACPGNSAPKADVCKLECRSSRGV
jgi:hypothetical protein